jgi:hypothetical protein
MDPKSDPESQALKDDEFVLNGIENAHAHLQKRGGEVRVPT